MNRLKYFRIWFQFHQDIWIFKKTPQCASHRGVRLFGVHHTAESSVCFNPKFYKCYFSVIFIRNWYCKSQIVQGIFFTLKFFEKMKLKDVASTKTQKTDIFKSARLHGVLPNSESDSAVCITPRSQAPRCASLRRVKMHTGESKSKSLRVSGCL